MQKPRKRKIYIWILPEQYPWQWHVDGLLESWESLHRIVLIFSDESNILWSTEILIMTEEMETHLKRPRVIKHVIQLLENIHCDYIFALFIQLDSFSKFAQRSIFKKFKTCSRRLKIKDWSFAVHSSSQLNEHSRCASWIILSDEYIFETKGRTQSTDANFSQ